MAEKWTNPEPEKRAMCWACKWHKDNKCTKDEWVDYDPDEDLICIDFEEAEDINE